MVLLMVVLAFTSGHSCLLSFPLAGPCVHNHRDYLPIRDRALPPFIIKLYLLCLSM